MSVYSYEKTHKSKKGKAKIITETWYFYGGKYTDQNTGQRINYKKRGFKSKVEASDAERRFLIEVKDTKTSSMTFSDLCLSYQNYCAMRKKGSTIETTEGHIRIHIEPVFGLRIVNDIQAKDALDFQKLLSDKGYAINTINSIFASLKKIIEYGTKFCGVKENVCRHVSDLRKVDNIDAPLKYWEYDDFIRFAKEIDDQLYFTYYCLLYYTGIRRSEGLALNWKDINLKTGYLSITKTLTRKVNKAEYAKGITFKLTPPKSPNSIRYIKMPDVLTEILHQWKLESMSYEGYTANSFVFGIDKPLPYSSVDRNIKKWARAANIIELSPHGLRHSHISFLINNDANIKAIADRAGDTIDVIEKTYAHLFQSKEIETVNIINRFENEIPIAKKEWK